MNLLYAVNPRRRRRKSKAHKSRKHRSAAQRAATRRLISFNKGKSAPALNPRRRRRSRAFRRNPTGRARSMFGAVRSSGAITLLKNGAIGGAGAVVVDIGMGYASQVLPAAIASPVNNDGSANWAYVGTKTALALALGLFGRRIPVAGPYVSQMAEGALTVMAYQIMRPMVPATIALGYFNPAPTMRPIAGVGGVRRYVSNAGRAGAYTSIPVRANNAVTRGASAAQVVDIVGQRRARG